MSVRAQEMTLIIPDKKPARLAFRYQRAPNDGSLSIEFEDWLFTDDHKTIRFEGLTRIQLLEMADTLLLCAMPSVDDFLTVSIIIMKNLERLRKAAEVASANQP